MSRRATILITGFSWTFFHGRHKPRIVDADCSTWISLLAFKAPLLRHRDRPKGLYPLIWLLSGVLPVALAASEPTYEGKSAGYWIDHFSAQPNGMQETIKAFKSMGSNAVPFLIEVVQQKSTGLGEAMDEALYKKGLERRVPGSVVKALPSAMRTEDRRDRATFLIGEIGPDGAAAIPALLAVLNDPTAGWRMHADARGALLAMGEKLAANVPEFIDYLKSADTRQMGAVLLGVTGPKAKPAVPALLGMAESTNLWEAIDAANALWLIDRQTNIALAVFTKCLRSANSTHQQLALIYLGRMGTAAKGAAPQVQAMLFNREHGREAEAALRAIDPELLQATQQQVNQDLPAQATKLTQVIQSDDFKERYDALEKIFLLGPEAKPAVPALVEVLTGPPPALPGQFSWIGLNNSRMCAARALAEIGPGARAAVPALIAVLKEHKGYDVFYCRALGNIGSDARDAVPILEGMLEEQTPAIRLAAAAALTRIAPGQCSNAVGVLEALQRDPELARVWQTHDGMASPTARKDFQNPASRFFRTAASVPLWQIGLEKKPPVAAIVEELNKPSATDEIAYVELLGDIGPAARDALPALEERLDPKKFILLRRTAALAIRKIDPDEATKLGLPGILLVQHP